MRTPLAAALLSTVALVSGCGGGSNAATATITGRPDPGKAGVWLRSPDHEDCGAGVRIDPSRKIHNVDPLGGIGCLSGFKGVVAMADGSLVFATSSYGENPRIERRDLTGHTTTVAGGSGTPRTTAGHRLAVQRRRGVRVFRCGQSTATTCPVGLGTLGTVDAAGDIYVNVPQSKDDPTLLGSLLVITAEGTTHPLDLGDSPAKSSGMLSISGDGAQGILVVANRGAGEVLHVSSGRVRTLMAGKPGAKLGNSSTQAGAAIESSRRSSSRPSLPTHAISLVPGVVRGKHSSVGLTRSTSWPAPTQSPDPDLSPRPLPKHAR